MNNKWVEVFRNSLEQENINTEPYSDEEIMTIAKGSMAPIICEEQGIEYRWMFELYWMSLITMDPDQVTDEEMDLDLFKKRAKENTN